MLEKRSLIFAQREKTLVHTAAAQDSATVSESVFFAQRESVASSPRERVGNAYVDDARVRGEKEGKAIAGKDYSAVGPKRYRCDSEALLQADHSDRGNGSGRRTG